MAESNLDVIVIGAGIAGLVTANRAAQLGKRVVVLEKGTEDKYLCNSRYAYGTIHINYSDLEASEDSLMTKIETATEPTFQELFVAAMAFPHATAPSPHLAAVVTLPERTSSVDASGGRRRRRQENRQ